MIRYALACNKAHPFESWFPSSEAYDAQRAQGLLTCPVFGSAKVEKQIMALSVSTYTSGWTTPMGEGQPPSTKAATRPQQPHCTPCHAGWVVGSPSARSRRAQSRSEDFISDAANPFGALASAP